MNNLKYITLNQLMASVESDLHSFADNSMIDRGRVIKVIRKVNEDIGLKINKEKTTLIEIKDFKGAIPTDVQYVQAAWLCTETVIHESGEVFGTHTEDVHAPHGIQLMCDGKVCGDLPGVNYYVQQTFVDKIVKHKGLKRLSVLGNAFVSQNITCNPAQADSLILVHDDYDVSANFKEGKIYLNYLAEMVDEEGNILVLDHPLVRDYYEYAVKKHLIEVWLLNNDADVSEKWKLVKQELYEARLRALNFVNTVEYSQIKGVYEANRTRFYNKHMRLFQ